MTDDDERDEESQDGEGRKGEWFGGDEGSDDGGEPAAVDERDEESQDGEGREPLGYLREQVVDDATGSGDVTDSREATGSGDVSTGEDADANVHESARDGPLGDLAAGVDGRRERKTDEALFDEVDVGEVDADELWSQVEADEPTVEPRDEREIREVEKRKYCSQCQYFAEPPDVGCSHEGTDILQQVDMDHFEVADCPVILEDERLEDVTTE